MPLLDTLSPDILARICSFCSGEKGGLLSLATTCRALSAIALQTLWHTLISPSPLFLTLPEHLVVRRERETVNAWHTETWILHGHTHKHPARSSFFHSDLERFYYYASLVQSPQMPELSSAKHCDFVVSSEIWSLFRDADSKPIFPNLRHVTLSEDWRIYVQDPIPIRPFLSPSVQYLSIILHHYRQQVPDGVETGSSAAVLEFKDLLTNLPLICPDLRKLNIKTPPSLYFQDAVLHTVQGLSSLTIFRSDGIPLSPMGVAALSSLPNLTIAKISLRAADYTAPRTTQTPPSTVSFPTLRELEITADSAACVVALLGWSAVDPPRLTQLSVRATLTHENIPAQFLSITTAISLMRCRYTLEQIILSTHIPWIRGNDPEVDDLPPSTVAPLCDLPRLTCFRIVGYCNIAFDDAALAKMARAWPRLTVLSICQESLQSETDGVTLAALLDLVQHCPALEELDIALASIKRGDCEDVLARPLFTRAKWDGDTLGLREVCRLSSIGIGAPALGAEEVVAVAAALNAIFPHLTDVFSDERGMTRSRWCGIENVLAVFRKVREQERKYAQESARSVRNSHQV
ncbi:uncharacterized protein TRAVEDRAFT_41205 [Trametes versicolor FP-101664 SS1]|uniref:uncharacterized protein n=1 Tax=Trametes versicolor (strain FP-101664) TaxID=717944 RepID=UPI000462469E|nr:uncharacterized protein TRAVEDRAFT_41205 [Trametes versicolor FP-101664 SS1]EIW63777.1 hypothetical protein TRAVEDRAFT_41205 [Trametes versicolor FP-101664 SS1]